jgi:hypothetical protein
MLQHYRKILAIEVAVGVLMGRQRRTDGMENTP